MKLVMTLFVRNEEDILEANLDYHLEQGVDFVIATDNRSEDATPSILERYAREGHLRLLTEESDTYSQPEGMTRMARIAAEELGADWVINNDADEFWWPREGTLKDVFSAVPEDYGALAASRVNFVARPEEDGFFAERMTVSRVRELSATRDRSAYKYPFDRYAHYVMPKLAHRARGNVEIVDASHGVEGHDLATVPGWHPVDILHFPLRTYAHFEAKVRNGGRALEAHPNPGFNPHLRALYELYQSGRLPEYWADATFGDEAVLAGIADHRLVVDRRLQRWFRERRGAGADPAAATLPEPSGIEASMLREITVGEWHQSRALDLERKVANRDDRIRRLERRIEKLEGGKEVATTRLAALEGSPWWRLGTRLRAGFDSFRRPLGGRSPGGRRDP